MQWETMSDREKDAAVAEHVMGWSKNYAMPDSAIWSWYLPSGRYEPQNKLPCYTTDYNDFAEVLAALEQQDLLNKYIVHLLGMGGDYYLEPLNWSQARKLITAPLDIRCLAALRAIGIEA